MTSEQSMIEMFSRIHGTRPFGADAEIVQFGGTNLLVSTDSFSEREDFLSGLESEAMGKVMAYGAIADILACGAKPEFLVQAWNIDDLHDELFYERVAQGVQQVVSHYGAKVIGGDIGSAKEWCWTATVFASCKTPVCRVASQRVDFDLYATGQLGAANAAVFFGSTIPEPQLRSPVPGLALFATDTSGGLFDALENFRRVNNGMWLELDAERAVSPEVARSLPPGVEKGWALVGGVGEYELLFAVPAGTPVADAVKIVKATKGVNGLKPVLPIVKATKGVNGLKPVLPIVKATKGVNGLKPVLPIIGHGGFVAQGECDIRIMYGGKIGRMSTPPPDYRGIPRENWLAETAAYWTSLWR